MRAPTSIPHCNYVMRLCCYTDFTRTIVEHKKIPVDCCEPIIHIYLQSYKQMAEYARARELQYTKDIFFSNIHVYITIDN